VAVVYGDAGRVGGMRRVADRAPRMAMAVALVCAAGGVVSLAFPPTTVLAGLGGLLACHVPVLLGAWAVACRLRCGEIVDDADESCVATFVLTLQLYFIVLVVLGLSLGAIETLWRSVAVPVAGGVGIVLILLGGPLPGNAARREMPVFTVLVDGLLVSLALLVAYTCLTDPHYAYDALTYHLYFPVRWLQDGAISVVPTWFGDPAPTYAPAASAVYYAWLLLPMRADWLARCGQFAFWPLLLGAAGMCARGLGLSRATARLVVLLVVCMPAVAAQAGTAMVDVALAAHVVAVVGFGLRFARTGDRADVLGLCLGLGLMLGTKFVGVAFVAALAPLLVFVVWCGMRARRAVGGVQAGGDARSAADRASVVGIVVLAVVVGFGWYGRNLVVTGNPLYPLEVQVGGVTLFEGAYGRAQMENAVFNVRGGGVMPLVDTLVEAIGGAGQALVGASFGLARWVLLFVVLAVVYALVVGMRGRDMRGRMVVFALTIGLLIAGFWWVIPFQQPRFAWAPLVLLLIGALAGPNDMRGKIVATVAAIGWLVVALPALVSGLAWSIPVVVVVALVSVAILATRQRLRPAVVMPPVLVVALSAAFALATRAGDGPREAALRNNALLGAAWQWVDALEGETTIAYSGSNVPYFLTGRRFQQRAVHVPACLPPAGGLHAYSHIAGELGLGPPHTSEPAFHRYRMDPAVWLENLDAAGADVVVVNALFINLLLSVRHDTRGYPIERVWLEGLAAAPDGRLPFARRVPVPVDSVMVYVLDWAQRERARRVAARLPGFVRTETDAIDRMQQDRPPPGAPIRFYPHARPLIERHGLQPVAARSPVRQ